MLSAVMVALLLQMRFQSPSCTAGEGWEFLVRGTDVDKSPRWSETSDAPPLAPRVAIRAARSVLGRMGCNEAEDWELAAVALRPVADEPNVWVYVVTLIEPLRTPKGAVLGSTLRRAVDIPVLLDGTALTPSIGPWPPKLDDGLALRVHEMSHSGRHERERSCGQRSL